ncbi:probable chitinase 10 isoform X6 [Diabrotica virgifera virgifera]|uniref:Chitin-binding type-2 domain-containing protein n=1 Tax=Diabrotica virgifera virgifera TaxID=50390 RepID=A0ABM5K4J0_DIAVI|nr:probable chitinase 10 isoform X6 [Diabrotica virgifera virgifera]
MKVTGTLVILSVYFVLSIVDSATARQRPRRQLLSENKSDIEEDCKNGLQNYYNYPYDCQKYYTCREGKLYLSTCQDDLYWNSELRSCDIQANVNCSKIIPLPHPVCTDSRTTFYIYPYNCKKFYECYENVLYILECPDDLLWNNDAKVCDDSYNVDCSYIIPETAETDEPTSAPTSTSPVTTERPTTTTVPPPPTKPPVQCQHSGQYIPDPYNCSMYYECSNGVPVSMSCPGGEYWNPDEETCDWPFNVDCRSLFI